MQFHYQGLSAIILELLQDFLELVGGMLVEARDSDIADFLSLSIKMSH